MVVDQIHGMAVVAAARAAELNKCGHLGFATSHSRSLRFRLCATRHVF